MESSFGSAEEYQKGIKQHYTGVETSPKHCEEPNGHQPSWVSYLC